MKKTLLRVAAVLFVSGLLSACSEEEINPVDTDARKKTEQGVTREHGF